MDSIWRKSSSNEKMARKKSKLKSTKRFGTRYGITGKLKFEKIEQKSRKLHKCPYCHYVKAKRTAAGIWECKKCGAKFAGDAYDLTKKSYTKRDEVKEKASIAEDFEEIETVEEDEETEEEKIIRKTSQKKGEEDQDG